MQRFEFYSAARVAFGRGQVARLGELASEWGATAALVYNGAGPGAGGATGRAAESLAAGGVRVSALVRVRGEPQARDVDSAVGQARDAGCDLVVGVGGGSAVDAAKAVAGLLTNGGAATDYMEVVGKGQKLRKPAAPWFAVPTTAGTGAEVTRNAVVGLPEKRFKASIRSEHLLPRVALIDPELGVPVPPDVTARSGMDALCQLVESYTSNGAGPLTDALALKGLESAARSLRLAFHDGADLDAREGMALAALLSGVTLTNAGLGAVHGFAAPLGANFPAPHGAVCAVLLPHVIAANAAALREQSPDHPTLSRYADVGRVLGGDAGLGRDEAVAAAARVTKELVCELRIPSLGAFGVTEAAVPDLVALARRSSSMRYNPVVLSDEVLADVLRKAIA